MYNRSGYASNQNTGFQKTYNSKQKYKNNTYSSNDEFNVFNKAVKKPIRRYKQSLVLTILGKKLIAGDNALKYLKSSVDTKSDAARILAKDCTEILDKIVYQKNFKKNLEQRLDDYLTTTLVLNNEKKKYLKQFIEKECPIIIHHENELLKTWKSSLNSDGLLLSSLYDRCNTKQHCGDNLKPLILSTNLHDTIYFSLDLEEFENSGKITEIGITIYDPRENGYYDKNGMFHNSINPHFRTYHIIIKERVTHRNKKFIFCKKQESLFNETFILDFSNTHKFLQEIWDRYFNNGTLASNGYKVALVGQSVMGDIKSLKKEFQLEEHFEFDSQLQNTVVNQRLQNSNKRFKARKNIVNVYDTEKLSRIILGDSISVKKQLRFLNIPHTALHNALNDSYYTLLSFIKMTDIDSRINLKLDDPIQIFKNFEHLRLLNQQTDIVVPLEIAYLLGKEEKSEFYGKNEEESKSAKKLNKLTQQLEFGLPLDIDTYWDIPY
ncbi:hypothetical protein QEN19_000695 [Hanseniaspora menglaensis]